MTGVQTCSLPICTGSNHYSLKRKLLIIVSGLRFAIVNDFSVAYKMLISVAILITATVFHRYVNVLLLLLATGLMMITEIVNSAIESLCDFVEERHNEKIKVIKDIAAAAAGISIFVWLVVLGVELVELWSLFAKG